jgi:hypothetical protein
VALDAALLGAAALMWAAATATLRRVRRPVLSGALPEAPLDATVVDRRILLWGGALGLLGATFTASGIERGVLLLLCAALALFVLSWGAEGNRGWWGRVVDRRRRALRPAVWALLLIGLFAWFAAWSLIGRIAVEALQG